MVVVPEASSMSAPFGSVSTRPKDSSGASDLPEQRVVGLLDAGRC
jgi:hypothetical protein